GPRANSPSSSGPSDHRRPDRLASGVGAGMSHLFQRPLCDMGAAYDFAYRPTLGEPAAEDGGGCDDRPGHIELYAAGADRSRADASWRSFSVCPEHETQLR